MMKIIKTVDDIDYENNAEGRLLFAAIVILMTSTYRDKTPNEVVAILNNKANEVFAPEANERHEQINEILNN